jgi:hypothetical protein
VSPDFPWCKLKSPDSLLAFNKLKELFTVNPLLLHFDFEKDKILHVDSSGYAIAAVLSQPDKDCELHPVSYFSQKLSDREREWQVFDLELLAIVSAFEEWRAWLMGRSNPVKVFSDHSNLRYFKKAKYLSPKQARWATFLDNFNMLIYHIEGSKNPADPPSWREDYLEGKRIKSDPIKLMEKLSLSEISFINNGTHDLSFQRPTDDMINYLQRHHTDVDKTTKGLKMKNGVLWHQGCIYVPTSLQLRHMKMYHDSPMVGHPGIAQTLSILTRTFSWPGLRTSVFDYVKTCES